MNPFTRIAMITLYSVYVFSSVCSVRGKAEIFGDMNIQENEIF